MAAIKPTLQMNVLNVTNTKSYYERAAQSRKIVLENFQATKPCFYSFVSLQNTGESTIKIITNNDNDK